MTENCNFSLLDPFKMGTGNLGCVGTCEEKVYCILQIIQGEKISWFSWIIQNFSSELAIMPLCNKVWPHKTIMQLRMLSSNISHYIKMSVVSLALLHSIRRTSIPIHMSCSVI